jgi:hypothetical protein
LIVTMIRILGLCWAHDYERTPAYTPDQLSELTGRPRTTLYRHLNRLEKELGWLRVDRNDRRLILRPLIGVTSREGLALTRSPTPVNATLCQALSATGIENPARDRLARAPGQPPRTGRSGASRSTRGSTFFSVTRVKIALANFGHTAKGHRTTICCGPKLAASRLHDASLPPFCFLITTMLN